MLKLQGTLTRGKPQGRSTGHIQREAGTGERERRASGATTLEDREEPVTSCRKDDAATICR